MFVVEFSETTITQVHLGYLNLHFNSTSCAHTVHTLLKIRPAQLAWAASVAQLVEYLHSVQDVTGLSPA